MSQKNPFVGPPLPHTKAIQYTTTYGLSEKAIFQGMNSTL